MSESSSSNQAIADWLAQRLPGTTLTLKPLRVEASHRRFFRVRDGEQTWVAMDSPPDKEQNDAFLRLARSLHSLGVPVPELVACDLARGYVLMSDLGDTELIDAYAGDQRESAVGKALQALLHLQTLPHELAAPYTEDRFYMELGIFDEWFVDGLLGQTGVALRNTALQQTWPTLVAATQAQPQCLVHRDFHCQNLLLSESGEIGIVDFQDALIGPALYDVASLLHDCYYDFSEEERRRYFTTYCQASPWFEEEPLAAMELTALQRQLKAIGIFARLKLRDDKASHLRHIPYCLQHCTEIADRYPATQDLASALRDLQPHATIALRKLEAKP